MKRYELFLLAVCALCVALVLAAVLHGQTPPPGTVTVTSTTTISATDGTGPGVVTCNFMASGANIQTTCSGSGASLTSTFPVPVPAPGTVGTFSAAGNTITWSFTPAAAPATGTAWQVVANGTSKSGTF